MTKDEIITSVLHKIGYYTLQHNWLLLSKETKSILYVTPVGNIVLIQVHDDKITMNGITVERW
jgi:hypothetical protein